MLKILRQKPEKTALQLLDIKERNSWFLKIVLMPITIENPNLNDQQMLMLRLLTNPLPEADFAQVRRFVVKLLAKQIDSTVEKWEQDNNITEETYEKLSKEHFRSKPSK